MKTIGLFGITANPPHSGHMKAIKDSLKKCDEVWISLVFVHPFEKKFIDYVSRFKMINLIINEFVKNNFFSNEEKKKIFIKELDKEYFEKYNKVPYSYDLLSYCTEKNTDCMFKLIIGEDNFITETWEKFYKYKEIENKFGVIVIKDFGLHSTNIRDLINKNKEVGEFVGKDIEKYLKDNNFYKDGV